MESLLSKFEPKLVWKHFDEIRKIPHESKNETALAQYVISVAKQHNYEYEQDEVGNVVIRKAATPGHENASIMILQSHLDMVCEKNSDVDFDFAKDAIQLEIDGDWLTAKGTTLGADNGIGVAAALAVLEDDSLTHGPLELLFTVDEETGLTGASRISPDFLKGRLYLNLDSEEEGVFTIGCSGGADTGFTLPISRQAATDGTMLQVKISGLKGGHSGLDINTGRGNAIKILNHILDDADQKFSLSVVNFNGGNKRNAIAREASADIIVPSDALDKIKARMETSFEELKDEFQAVEKDMTMTIEPLDKTLPAPLDDQSKKTLLNLLKELPHGVLGMSKDIEGLVETSTNLATIATGDDKVEIGQSSRSSVASALTETRNRLKDLGEAAGASLSQPEGYPGWAPNLDSKVLKLSKEAYQACFGKEPEVAAIHAGLECGLIGEKFPGMDMVSYGPDLRNPHSPDEKIHIASVEKFWKLTAKILEMVA